MDTDLLLQIQGSIKAGIPATTPNGIYENVVVVSSDLPNRVSLQTEVCDKLSFGLKRPPIIKRNHDLRGLVVDIRLITHRRPVSPSADRKRPRQVRTV